MFWSHFWQVLVSLKVAIFGNLLREFNKLLFLATSRLTKSGKNENQPVAKFGNFGPVPIPAIFGMVRQLPIFAMNSSDQMNKMEVDVSFYTILTSCTYNYCQIWTHF